MVMVQLKQGIPRWHRHGWSIKRGDVKECPGEIYAISNGRLLLVKKQRTTGKKTRKKQYTPKRTFVKTPDDKGKKDITMISSDGISDKKSTDVLGDK